MTWFSVTGNGSYGDLKIDQIKVSRHPCAPCGRMLGFGSGQNGVPLGMPTSPLDERRGEIERIEQSGWKRSDSVDRYEKELDFRERRFVQAYVCGDARSIGNAYRSAIVAGYPHSMAQTLSSGWVLDPVYAGPGQDRKPHVFRAIQRLRDEVQQRFGIDDDRIIKEVQKIAFFNAANYIKSTSQGDPYVDLSEMTMDDMAAIAETTLEDFLDGRGEDAREVRRVKVKSHDKISALALLARIFGLEKKHVIHSNDPNNPIGVRHDLSRLSDDELEMYLKLVRKMEGHDEDLVLVANPKTNLIENEKNPPPLPIEDIIDIEDDE